MPGTYNLKVVELGSQPCESSPDSRAHTLSHQAILAPLENKSQLSCIRDLENYIVPQHSRFASDTMTQEKKSFRSLAYIIRDKTETDAIIY